MVCVAQNEFDEKWINKIYVSLPNVNERIKELLYTHSIKEADVFAGWLLKAISVIDLTTLSGDDTKSNVQRLCYKAANPLPMEYYTKLGFTMTGADDVPVRTAAVCVYPTKVADAANVIKRMGLEKELHIAAVATGFPTGLYPLKTRLAEIRYTVEQGATEIDVVIDRSLVLSNKWSILFEELKDMRKSCGQSHLKVILGIGELGTMTNVYKASMVAMAAGADFIKTSTGKENVNATLAVGLVMCRAIRHFYLLTGIKVGLKPAGGIRTVQDAVSWLVMIKEELGDDWLNNKKFRIGASGLLGNIERWLHDYVTGQIAQSSTFNFI